MENAVGAFDGDVEGALVGFLVGDAVGAVVGAGVAGTVVGGALGSGVARSVGETVGFGMCKDIDVASDAGSVDTFSGLDASAGGEVAGVPTCKASFTGPSGVGLEALSWTCTVRTRSSEAVTASRVATTKVEFKEETLGMFQSR